MYHQTEEFDSFPETVGQDQLPPTYEAPSIRKAREFRRSLIPRRFPDPNQPTGYRLNDLGEEVDKNKNKLPRYSMFSESDSFSEFGIGISIYFKSLKAMFVLIIICAFISLVAIHENTKYNQFQSTSQITHLHNNILMGSVYYVTLDSLHLRYQGASDIACSIILIIFIIVAIFLEKKVVNRLDASLLSTHDYSIEVTNVPRSVTDPDEYYDFFKVYGDVVSVTVLRKNGGFLQALSLKQELDDKYDHLLQQQPNGQEGAATGMKEQLDDTTPFWKQWLQNFGLFETASSVKAKIDNVNKLILAERQKDFYPNKVYVVFNKESARNVCLEKTSTAIFQSRSLGYSGAALFHNKVLKIREPDEPSDVLYENNHYSTLNRTLRVLASYGLCAGFLVISAVIIRELTNQGNVGVAIFITLLNSGLPVIIRTVTLVLEKHLDRGDIQQSILLKLVVTRCINAGVLIYIVTPHDDIFGREFIAQIQNILLADALFQPIWRFLHLIDLGKRFIIAPMMARTQEELNLQWQGMDWTLAERYTDTIKTIFTGFFFAVILPSGLFITAFAMVTTYLVDKYSLFNLWKRGVFLNGELSVVARYYFGAMIVWVHIYMSRIFFSRWPYGGPLKEYTHSDCGFLRCTITDQMTTTQSYIARFYNGLSIAVFFGLILQFFLNNLPDILAALGLTCGLHQREKDSSVMTFREIAGADIYVPNIISPKSIQPILCADVSTVPPARVPIVQDMFVVINPVELSVVNNGYLEDIDPTELKTLFSAVKYYASESERAGGAGGHHVTESGNIASRITGNKYAFRTASHGQSEILEAGLHDTTAATATATGAATERRPGSSAVSTATATGAMAARSDLLLRQKSSFSHSSLTRTGSSAFRLPVGWERKMTADGRPYYIDHVHKRTQWDAPVQHMSIKKDLSHRVSAAFADEE